MAKLDLKPGQKVLDVGCGIGGGDFYMADKFDVHVVGIDLSINMVSFALERAIGLKCSVEFEVADCTKKTYPENSFDVIYSRDTILHIQVRYHLFAAKIILYFGTFVQTIAGRVLCNALTCLLKRDLINKSVCNILSGQTCIVQIFLQMVEAWRYSSYK